MGAKKNRRSPRAQVSLVARYRSPTAFEFVSEECFDLSVGGMFIKSPAPAPAGTLLKLECDVDEGSAKIRGVARVVWLREQPVDGHPAGMGVKFVKLDPGGREVIHGILERVGTESDDGGEARRSSAPPSSAPEPFRRSPSSRPEAPGAHADPSAGLQGLATSSDAITVRPPSGEGATAGANDAVAFVNDTQPLPANARSSPGGGARQDARGLRDRLEQAKRGASDGADGKPSSSAKPKKAATSATKSGKPAVAKPAPRDTTATRGGGGRAWIYVVIALLAATGVYALSSRRGPATDASAAAPAAPPHEPAPQPEPVEAPPVAIEPAPAAQPTPAAVAPEEKPTPRYILEIVTKPEGARVTVGPHSVVAPGEIELGELTDTVVLKAEKTGYQSAAARIDRVGFMLDEGALRRRIVLKLTEQPKPEARDKPRKPPADPPKAAEPAPSEPAKSDEPAKATAEAEVKITPAPEPAPAVPEPSSVPPTAAAAAAAPVPAPVPPPESKPAPAPSEPKPESAAKPKPTTSKQTPLQTATACLSTGDNACVVAALEGKAKTAQELELLIETFRVMGNAEKAEKYMQVYVKKYPSERRSPGYRRVLERRQSESGGAEP